MADQDQNVTPAPVSPSPEPAAPAPASSDAPSDGGGPGDGGRRRRRRRRGRGRRGGGQGSGGGPRSEGAAGPEGTAGAGADDAGGDEGGADEGPEAGNGAGEGEGEAAGEAAPDANGGDAAGGAPAGDGGGTGEGGADGDRRRRRRRRGGRRHRRHGEREGGGAQGGEATGGGSPPAGAEGGETRTAEAGPPAGGGEAPRQQGGGGGRGRDRDRDRGRGGRGERGERFGRWSRGRRESGPVGPSGPVVQGHSSGWSNAGHVSLDDALMSDKGEELWGTDTVSQHNVEAAADQTWTDLNDEVQDVETGEEPAETAAAPAAELGLEDDLDLVPGGEASASAPAAPTVVDAARDAEGQLIHAPAPLAAEPMAPPPVEEPLGQKVMLINVAEGDECRVGILDSDLRLDEIYAERVSTVSHVGNIYKGVVTNVERSIQAAFVDIGLEKSGFLHISDLQPQYFMTTRDGRPMLEDVGRKLSRRDRPPIQDCLKRGQEIVVQIIKEGIGTKGPTLTSYVSIPGRYLVLMPGMTRLGVSRKVEDEAERRQARQQLEQLHPPGDLGFIIRTQGVGRSQIELQRDLDYLQRLWVAIDKRIRTERGAGELFRESDLIIRTLRDVYTRAIGRILVDSEEVASRAREFLSIVDPEAAMAVEYYREKSPLFHRFHIEEEIARIHDKRVPLPSGGSLIIESTEALVAIDVNSGKSRQQSDAEETAYRTNLEAAAEIARQLRLRDLGGVIICDFIDMRHERHRLAVERALFEAMRKDRARTKVLPISRFGIIEMTRQRMRPSLKRTIYSDCPCCHGTGLTKTLESVCLDVLRNVRQLLQFAQVASAEVSVHPDVAHVLLNQKRKAVLRMEIESGKHVVIKACKDYWPDQTVYTYADRSGRSSPVDEAFILGRGFRGPVHATPVGPIGVAIKPSTISGPQVVGYEPVSDDEGEELDESERMNDGAAEEPPVEEARTEAPATASPAPAPLPAPHPVVAVPPPGPAPKPQFRAFKSANLSVLRTVAAEGAPSPAPSNGATVEASGVPVLEIPSASTTPEPEVPQGDAAAAPADPRPAAPDSVVP